MNEEEQKMNEERLRALGFEIIDDACPNTDDIIGNRDKHFQNYEYTICTLGYIAGVIDTINRLVEEKENMQPLQKSPNQAGRL